MASKLFCNRCKETGHLAASCPSMPTVEFGAELFAVTKPKSQQKPFHELKMIDVMAFHFARAALGRPLEESPDGHLYFVQSKMTMTGPCTIYCFIGATGYYAAAGDAHLVELLKGPSTVACYVDSAKFCSFSTVGAAIADGLLFIVPRGGETVRTSLCFGASECATAIALLNDHVKEKR